MVQVAVFDKTGRINTARTDEMRATRCISLSAKSMFCSGNIAATNRRFGAALQKSPIQSF